MEKEIRFRSPSPEEIPILQLHRASAHPSPADWIDISKYILLATSINLHRNDYNNKYNNCNYNNYNYLNNLRI
jgi:hypothetical protein